MRTKLIWLHRMVLHGLDGFCTCLDGSDGFWVRWLNHGGLVVLGRTIGFRSIGGIRAYWEDSGG